jgi:hypothetical protein
MLTSQPLSTAPSDCVCVYRDTRVPCSYGTFKPSAGNHACTACAAGTYSTAHGAMSAATCLLCPENSHSPVAANDIATMLVPRGQYRGRRRGVCVVCGGHSSTDGLLQTLRGPALGSGGSESVHGCLTCELSWLWGVVRRRSARPVV